MNATIENNVDEGRIKRYNEAVQNEETEWINEFWTEIAEDNGYTKQNLIDTILDDYNSGQISKTARDYYMSTLVDWPGQQQ